MTIQICIPHYDDEAILSRIAELLKSHGAELKREEKYCTVSLPEGTIHKELLPRVSYVRYKIILPDKYEILEIVGSSGLSDLGFNDYEVEHLS